MPGQSGPDDQLDDALRASLRALIEGLDGDAFEAMRSAISEPSRDIADDASPATVALHATARRFATLGGSNRDVFRLKGFRGAALLERMVEIRAENLGLNRAARHAAPAEPDEQELAIRNVYRWSVGRTPQPAEVATWSSSLAAGATFPQFVNAMENSAEAYNGLLDPESSYNFGEFVRELYLVIVGRAPLGAEIVHFRRQLRAGASRESVALSLLRERLRKNRDEADPEPKDLDALDLGGGATMTRADWSRRLAQAPAADAYSAPTLEAPVDAPLVTAIAYAGSTGPSLAPTLAALYADPGFAAFGDVIVIHDAASQAESDRLAALERRGAAVQHHRFEVEIGLGRALNLAVGLARGRYLVRLLPEVEPLPGATARQAATLESAPFADVAYGDAYRAFAETSSEDAMRAGARGRAGLVTQHAMMRENALTDAPMWRKSLHDALGPFDPACGAAVELDFWFRCVSAERVFYKLNEPLGVRRGRGAADGDEARSVTTRHTAATPADVLSELSAFRAKLGLPAAQPSEASRYELAQDRLMRLSAAMNPARARMDVKP